MFAKGQVTCWVVTEGKTGMENQCVGLAEALNTPPIIKRLRFKSPWKELVPTFHWGLSYGLSKKDNVLVPPWPDIVISTGRQGAAGSLLIKKLAKRDGKKCFTIHIQKPATSPKLFDLLIIPQHDKLTGPNVLTTLGSLHRLTPQKLLEAGRKFEPVSSALPRPHIGVIIGGANAVYKFSNTEMLNIAQQLKKLAQVTGGSLLITPSRRTGNEKLDILKTELKSTPHFLWDFETENPYFGILHAAEYFLVTADSTNMVTEACWTGKPVFILNLEGGSSKFEFFHNALQAAGHTRIFKGTLEKWRPPALDEIALLAEKISTIYLSFCSKK